MTKRNMAGDLRSKAYGDPEAFRLGQQVTRPDGTQFIQGDLSTYVRFTVRSDDDYVLSYIERHPRGLGTSHRTGKLADDATRGAGYKTSITASPFGQPGFKDDAVPHTLLPDRTVYRALWVERTYTVPGGQEVTLRSLRHSKEGHGGRA